MNQSIINVIPLNPNLSECHLKVLYHGLNRNNSYISKEVAELLANKLPGTPIVGVYMEDKKDFDDHGERIAFENGEIVLKKITKSFGFVKQDTKIWWQTFQENGNEKEYLMCEGYLWTETYPEVKRVINKGNWQSMEFIPESVKGQWKKENNKEMFVIEDANFRALCILGEDVEPCFETAAIGAPNTLFSKESILSDFNQIKYNIEKSLGEGGEVMPIVEIEIPATEVEVSETMETETVEVVEEKEVTEDNEVKVDTVEESTEPLMDEAVETVEEAVDTQAEFEATILDLTEKLNKALDELNVTLEQYAKAEEELADLRQLKTEIDTNAKNAMFAKFYMLDEADIAPIKEKMSEYTVEEIEKELSVIAFRKKVNFSLEEEKETVVENEEVITSFNAVVNDTMPLWLRAVENNIKNRA